MAFRGAQNREWPVAMRPVFLCGLCRETAPKSKESETILEADKSSRQKTGGERPRKLAGGADMCL